MVSTDMIYPTESITDLYRNLRPYYKDSKLNPDGYSIDSFAFRINNTAYSFYICDGEKIIDIIVMKKTIE